MHAMEMALGCAMAGTQEDGKALDAITGIQPTASATSDAGTSTLDARMVDRVLTLTYPAGGPDAPRREQDAAALRRADFLCNAEHTGTSAQPIDTHGCDAADSAQACRITARFRCTAPAKP